MWGFDADERELLPIARPVNGEDSVQVEIDFLGIPRVYVDNHDRVALPRLYREGNLLPVGRPGDTGGQQVQFFKVLRPLATYDFVQNLAVDGRHQIDVKIIVSIG